MKWCNNGIEENIYYVNGTQVWNWFNKKEDFVQEAILTNSTYSYFLHNAERCFPYSDKVKEISKNFVIDIPKDAMLLFDKASAYPRYKLCMSDHKRCIKPSKADFIVVPDDTNNYRISEGYIVKCNDKLIFFNTNELRRFGKMINGAILYLSQFFNKCEIIYEGPIIFTNKYSEFVYKYIIGEYDKKFITDSNLDKLINTILVDPQFEELLSIAEMLDSDDVSIRKMALKTLSAYNADKYKLSLRITLLCRDKDISLDINDVATKQLIKTLNISKYSFYSMNGVGMNRRLSFCYSNEETYDVEDIAIAKRLTTALLQKLFNKYISDLYKKFGEIVPDAKLICD